MHFRERLKIFPHGLWWAGCLSFIGTCALGAVLLFGTSVMCDALLHFSISTISDLMRGLFMLVVYVPVMLWLGIRTYRRLRKRSHILNMTKGTVSYFILLAFVVFPFQFIGIGTNLRNLDMERSICDKSNSNGTFTESVGLNIAEYTHLQTLLPRLPVLPLKSDSINIQYYSDGFLPDINLEVRCAVNPDSVFGVPAAVQWNKDGPSGWMLDTALTDRGIAWLIFSDGES